LNVENPFFKDILKDEVEKQPTRYQVAAAASRVIIGLLVEKTRKQRVKKVENLAY
jgi:hypothetical protein